MALPKLDSPTYETELPSTGKKIKYRPFLVKEQKILMMAQESDKQDEMMASIGQLINTCTFGEIDAPNSPIFDIEYIFLKIRGKSVGEKVKIMVTCPDDGKTKVPVNVNLEDINVQMTIGHTNELKISDNIKMVMKYPMLKDVLNSKSTNTTEQVFDIMEQCVYEVHDGDKIYQRVDITTKDIRDFVDSFNTEQFKLVTEFFESMPKLRHVVNVTNPNTKVKNEITIEGLDSFLG
jgi:hypothetical protein